MGKKEDPNSILGSIRKLIGSDPYFDPDLIMHINTVFGMLQQIGVGPDDGFYIEDGSTTWDEYIDDTGVMNMVKTYMFLRVKVLFDSASESSYLIDTYNKKADELEWRLNIEVDPKKGGDDGQ